MCARALALACLAIVLAAGSAAAQGDYPARLVRIIVPYAVGGTTDSAAAPLAAVPVPPRVTLPPSASVFGRYHAVVIGNERYQHLTSLKTPAADARAVADLLRTQFGFQSVRLLVDATRAQMVRALDETRRQLGEDDNLLIYYAGHGLEPVLDVGGAGHSVFARAFLETLRAAPTATDLTSIFGRLRRNVLLRADDGGDFIFVRRP